MTSHNTLSHICVGARQNRSPSGNHGGYKKDLLEVVLTPLEIISTICSSCEGVMRVPQFSDQGYKCRSCLDGGEGRPADVINSEINKLRVHCPFREEGCIWSGAISLLVLHVEGCDMYPVACSLGCGGTVKRMDVNKHENEDCSERTRICEFCLFDFRVSQFSFHIQVCPNLPLKCPNGCDTKEILRKDMDIHISDVCPLSMVKCHYKKYGCDNPRKRRDLDTHETEFVVKHIRMMDIHMEKMDQRMGEMKKASRNNKGLKWEICGVKQKFMMKQEMFSSAFYVNNYKFNGMVKFPTQDDEEYLGVFVYLCVGVFDDPLEWPFLGKVTITLVNLLDPEDSITSFFLTENCGHFTRRGTKDHGGFGFPTFVTKNELLAEISSQDKITIKIEIERLDQHEGFTS